MKFEDFNLSDNLMQSIKRQGFTEPTKIQAESIPLILEGKDVIGESATGSGKTLAFGAGMIDHTEPHGGIQALALVPTRELAEQVKDEIKKLAFNKKLKVLAIYGGVSINTQITQLKSTDIVIATPGRLLDHLNRRTINLSKVKLLVLDEADRMVEMGFIEDVEQIILSCPRERQTLLFSATMYEQALDIAHQHMNNPIKIQATKMVDPTKLTQHYYDVPANLKKELLIHLLKQEKSDLVMVFCNTRRATESICNVIKANGIKAAPIHGGLNQPKRLKAIELFNHGKFNVLVCTDVAARGLDIQGVTHIYNYDLPKEPCDYVHRIGRTARAGQEGLVIN
ncbi:MAG: DEAD/DEAH box helicase, partial [Nanoarchaeota archaeon]|nr:DEAD/DEAH box helicase [Nanoarchaeota archaeon]